MSLCSTSRFAMIVAVFGLLHPAVGDAAEPIRVTTEDGIEIVGDFYPAAASDSPSQPAAAVILLHMYQSDRSAYKPLAEALTQAGIAALAIDMRGHGESGGSKREELRKRAVGRDESLFQAMWRDVKAAHGWLIQNDKIDPSRVALVGASVGCSVALDYAVRDRSVDVIVCMTPGTNYLGVDSTGPIRTYGKRPVLLLATEDEREATDALSRLNSSATAQIVGKGRVHGTQMFGKITGIEQQIVDFIRQNLGDPREQQPVVARFGSDHFFPSAQALQQSEPCRPDELRWFSSAKEAGQRGLKPASP